MFRTRHRRDSNHNEILDALMAVTFCIDIHNYGQGMGDILAVHVRTKQAVFIEVKSSAKDKLTPSEAFFGARFPNNWTRVNNVSEALKAIGVT